MSLSVVPASGLASAPAAALTGVKSPFQQALGRYPGAQLFARFDDKYGGGGVYFADDAVRSFADVVNNPPAGEPTDAGMLVDGSDEPALVQGRGVERMASPSFEDPADWLTGDGWSTGVGYADCDGSQAGNSNLYQDDVLPPIGSVVEVTFVVENRTVGSVRPYGGLGGAGTSVSTNGTHTQVVIVTSNTSAYLQATSNFVGRITKLSYKQVLPFIGCSNPDELTLEIEFSGVSTAAVERSLLNITSQADHGVTGNHRAYLYYWSDGSLYLGIANSSWQSGLTAGGSSNDGGLHNAIIYLNKTTGEIALSVDGAAFVTGNKAGVMPSGFSFVDIMNKQAGGAASSQSGGNILQLVAASGDHRATWTGQ